MEGEEEEQQRKVKMPKVAKVRFGLHRIQFYIDLRRACHFPPKLKTLSWGNNIDGIMIGHQFFLSF